MPPPHQSVYQPVNSQELFAIEEFERLKALRQELPDEPIFDPQPEPKETT